VYLRQFFIERDARGRGLGTEALALLTKTRFPPGAQITVDVLASNPQGERFWAKAGFTAYARTMVSRPATLRPPG
jgi:GNAT superfamily N-acetyltransferase